MIKKSIFKNIIFTTISSFLSFFIVKAIERKLEVWTPAQCEKYQYRPIRQNPEGPFPFPL
jgi:hypothetical protein